MPKIILINELKNTANISKFVEESDEPVFLTKKWLWIYGLNEYRCL
jgi:hypothetical protein